MLEKKPERLYKMATKSVTLLNTLSTQLFTITGLVNIVFIVAKVTEATNVTTLANFEVIPGTNLAIDLSGLPAAGDYLIVNGADKQPLLMDVSTSRIYELTGATDTEKPQGTTASADESTGNTGIKVNWTGDKNTDIDLTFYVLYQPLTPDGKVTPA